MVYGLFILLELKGESKYDKEEEEGEEQEEEEEQGGVESIANCSKVSSAQRDEDEEVEVELEEEFAALVLALKEACEAGVLVF
jgi:predicted metal-dependent peptidase